MVGPSQLNFKPLGGRHVEWEVWADGELVDVVLTPAGGARELTAKGLLSAAARLLFSIRAATFEEAMTFGWGGIRTAPQLPPCYVPMAAVRTTTPEGVQLPGLRAEDAKVMMKC